jgi:hypothetical protein
VVSDESCRLEMSARDARWIVFGLAIVDAPFELVEAPEAVRHEMAAWAGRFAAAGRWTSEGGARIPGCC